MKDIWVNKLESEWNLKDYKDALKCLWNHFRNTNEMYEQGTIDAEVYTKGISGIANMIRKHKIKIIKFEMNIKGDK